MLRRLGVTAENQASGEAAEDPGRPSDGRETSAAAQLAQLLAPRIQEISQAILAEMRREFVEQADVQDIDKQFASVKSITESFLTAAAEGRSMVNEEREHFVSVGEEACRCGVSLPSLIGTVRIAARQGWLYVNREARFLTPDSVRLQAVQDVGLVFLTFVAELCDVMTLGYERQQRTGTASGDDPRRLLVGELIRGSARPSVQLLERAQELGFDPRGRYALLFVYGKDPSTDDSLVRGDAAQAAAVIGEGTVPLLLRGALPHAVILAPVRSASAWLGAVQRSAASAHPQVRFLGSGVVHGLASVPSTYRSVRGLLRVARNLAGNATLAWDTDLELYRLLESVGLEERERFVATVLGAVLRLGGQKREALLGTLVALEAGDGKLAAVATRLQVHPKTVHYRLQRIKELTGLDPAAPADRLRLQLAHHMIRLSGAI